MAQGAKPCHSHPDLYRSSYQVHKRNYLLRRTQCQAQLDERGVSDHRPDTPYSVYLTPMTGLPAE